MSSTTCWTSDVGTVFFVVFTLAMQERFSPCFVRAASPHASAPPACTATTAHSSAVRSLPGTSRNATPFRFTASRQTFSVLSPSGTNFSALPSCLTASRHSSAVFRFLGV
ncbi:MAG: hypothetical protein K6E40_00840 [Desulfovibrio sp.]|nr:hypothetical protein [Desulfovibrio sp.]